MAPSHQLEEVVTAAVAAAAAEAAAAAACTRRQAWKTRQDAEIVWADSHGAAEAAFITSQAAIKEANAATAAVAAAAAATAATAKGLATGRAFAARWSTSTPRPVALSRASSIPRASTTLVAEAAAAAAAAVVAEEAAAATAAAAADKVGQCRLSQG